MSSDKEARQEKLAAYMRVTVGGLSLLGVYEFAPILLGGGLPSGMSWTLPVSGGVDRIPWFGVAGVSSMLPFAWESTRFIPKRVKEPRIKPFSWKVPIGKTYRGKWIYHDFSGVLPHAIVAGSTKFGKTAFLKLCLYILCQQQRPEHLQVVIIDMKGGASFEQFRWLPHVQDVYRNLEEADRALSQVEDEMWRRLEAIRFSLSQFKDVPTWPRILVVIDEGVVLADDKTTMKRLRRLASIGRQPGIHLIFGSQRPSHEILPLSIRDQMEARFIFHLNEPVSSQVVLGDNSASDMKRHQGRMIYQGDDGRMELQAAYIEESVLKSWLQSYADKVTMPHETGITLSVEGEYSEWG